MVGSMAVRVRNSAVASRSLSGRRSRPRRVERRMVEFTLAAGMRMPRMHRPSRITALSQWSSRTIVRRTPVIGRVRRFLRSAMEP